MENLKQVNDEANATWTTKGVQDPFCKYDNRYLRCYDEITLLVYVYLHRFRSWGEFFVNLSINDLLLYYNYKPNRNKGRINERVVKALQEMIDDGFIRYVECRSNDKVTSVQDVPYNTMFMVEIINWDEKWDPKTKFTQIFYEEVDELIESKIPYLGKALIVYLNIKKYMYTTSSETTEKLFAHVSEEKLAEECGFGISSVKKYCKTLCDIGIMYMRNYGSYKKKVRGKEVIVNSCNVYAVEPGILEDPMTEEHVKVDLRCHGFVGGFYRFCNNLPNNHRECDEWGEKCNLQEKECDGWEDDDSWQDDPWDEKGSME